MNKGTILITLRIGRSHLFDVHHVAWQLVQNVVTKVENASFLDCIKRLVVADSDWSNIDQAGAELVAHIFIALKLWCSCTRGR